ncbi:MAG: hypothetical protein J7M39_07525 [Anaerolineae bacterium]|nr:hypothetical protein [Anaerolineae bacterium]
MPPISLQQLYEQFGRLRAQLQNQQLSHQQFVEAVHQLQAQDQAGNWWTIDPQTGHYLTYTANDWVPATPAASRPAPQPTRQPARPASQAPGQIHQGSRPELQQQGTSGKPGCLASPVVTLLLSVGAAVVWFAYTSLSPSSEGYDFLTPAVIAGTPLALRFLQKPLDKLLGPLYKLLSALPRPLLIGAALAVPVVLGGIFTRSIGGYGGLRRSAFVSVILGYILTRRPEGLV